MVAYSPCDVRQTMVLPAFLGNFVTDVREHERLLSRGLHTVTETAILGDPQLTDADRGWVDLEELADYIAGDLLRVSQ